MDCHGGSDVPSGEPDDTVEGARVRSGFFGTLRQLWKSDRLVFIILLALVLIAAWATSSWPYSVRYVVIVGGGSGIAVVVLRWRGYGRKGRHSRSTSDAGRP